MQALIYSPSRRTLILPLLLFVSACATTDSGRIDPQTGYYTQLPEIIAEVADPSQDLSTVKLNPEDNCYWYRYKGPVETTMLPLRTRGGQPICRAPKEG